MKFNVACSNQSTAVIKEVCGRNAIIVQQSVNLVGEEPCPDV